MAKKVAQANKDKSGKTGMGNFQFPKKKIDTATVDQHAAVIDSTKDTETKPKAPKVIKVEKQVVQTETSKMTIVIPKPLHQKLKSHCALNGMKIREYITQLIDKDLK